jgi:ATP adenylyltransferase
VQVHDIYMKMLEELRATRPYVDISKRPFVSYNLVLTRSFLYLIPRRLRAVENIEINSIGFIGSFLVCDNKKNNQFLNLQQKGPLEFLAQVAYSKVKEITGTSKEKKGSHPNGYSKL